jgi:hypothetical protein
MTLKEYNGGRSWHLWDMPYKMRERPAIDHFKKAHAKELDFWKFVQYEFYQQWFRLKQYANASGIRIIGDLPIFVADDSADVWTNPSLFDLNEELVPNCVAGCPPDAFSKAGQLWEIPSTHGMCIKGMVTDGGQSACVTHPRFTTSSVSTISGVSTVSIQFRTAPRQPSTANGDKAPEQNCSAK